MQLSLFNPQNSQEVTELFVAVFSASEGEDEGRSIGELVAQLIADTPPQDLTGCVATEHGEIVGSIFFSRFTVPNGQLAFLLSPVAVSTQLQGTGVGQQLIRYGLEHIKSLGAELVITYGDPAFYSKVGFEAISTDVIPAPFPLSQPIGWLAQSLTGENIQAMPGKTSCVEAFNNPAHW